MIANRSAETDQIDRYNDARRAEDAGALSRSRRDPPQPAEESRRCSRWSRRPNSTRCRTNICGWRPTLWAGIRAAGRGADEGSRHLRSAGVRLMPTLAIRSAPRRARDLFRPHRGRCLGAADLGRAGRTHPRHRARRPRRDAPHAAVVGCRRICSGARCSMPAAAPARCRSRRRGAAPTWSRSICRRPWSAGARAAPARSRRSARSNFASATCSTRPWPLRPRRRDGFADPLPAPRHRSRCWRVWPTRTDRCSCCSPSRRARRRWR